jgi:hypothetical protein
MLIDIFLLPFFIFKWAFSLLFWVAIVFYIVGTDWFGDVVEWLQDKWTDAIRRWQ